MFFITSDGDKLEQLEHELVGAYEMLKVAEEIAKSEILQSALLRREIRYLRGCPLPPEPKNPDWERVHEYNRIVQYYSYHLQSNPPEGVK